MKPRAIASAVVALILGTACVRAEPARSAAQEPPCIRWATEARYRPYGYDHIVHIHNACTAVADCTVSTNVNPEPQRVLVPPDTEAEVVTWVGSPSREFAASVSCFLRRAE